MSHGRGGVEQVAACASASPLPYSSTDAINWRPAPESMSPSITNARRSSRRCRGRAFSQPADLRRGQRILLLVCPLHCAPPRRPPANLAFSASSGPPKQLQMVLSRLLPRTRTMSRRQRRSASAASDCHQRLRLRGVRCTLTQSLALSPSPRLLLL